MKTRSYILGAAAFLVLAGSTYIGHSIRAPIANRAVYSSLERRCDELEKVNDETRVKLDRAYTLLLSNPERAYSLDSFLDLLKEKQVKIKDISSARKIWDNLDQNQKQILFLSYLDRDGLYDSFDTKKKKRFDNSVKAQISEKDREKIEQNTFWEIDYDDPKSQFRMALFITLDELFH